MGKRRNFSAEFKARVALEALRGELTVSQIGAKHGVHANVVANWKKQALEGMAAVFESAPSHSQMDREKEIDRLHAKIGQLTVDNDFLKKAFARS